MPDGDPTTVMEYQATVGLVVRPDPDTVKAVGMQAAVETALTERVGENLYWGWVQHADDWTLDVATDGDRFVVLLTDCPVTVWVAPDAVVADRADAKAVRQLLARRARVTSVERVHVRESYTVERYDESPND